MNHSDTMEDCRQGIGHGKAAIIMGMNAQKMVRHRRDNLINDRDQITGHRPPISITQHNHVSPGRKGSLYHLARTTGIILISIEKMLRIKDDFLTF